MIFPQGMSTDKASTKFLNKSLRSPEILLSSWPIFWVKLRLFFGKFVTTNPQEECRIDHQLLQLATASGWHGDAAAAARWRLHRGSWQAVAVVWQWALGMGFIIWRWELEMSWGMVVVLKGIWYMIHVCIWIPPQVWSYYIYHLFYIYSHSQGEMNFDFSPISHLAASRKSFTPVDHSLNWRWDSDDLYENHRLFFFFFFNFWEFGFWGLQFEGAFFFLKWCCVSTHVQALWRLSRLTCWPFVLLEVTV